MKWWGWDFNSFDLEVFGDVFFYEWVVLLVCLGYRVGCLVYDGLVGNKFLMICEVW